MTQQPHILLITSDQHRADFLGCENHPVVRTPHLDQLAREGMLFEQAHSECPVCIPARTGLISGLHPATYGMPSYGANFRLERDRKQLLGGLLTEAGYQTTLVGKRHWHRAGSCTGGFETVIPIERCKRAQSLACNGWGYPTGTGGNELSPSASPLPPELHSTNWIIDHCVESLLERDQTRPMALWCSMVDPHPPIAIHEPYYSMYRGATFPAPRYGTWVDGAECPLDHQRHAAAFGGRLKEAERQDAAAVYAGMITNMDHQLGRLFGMLQRLGMWDNTLVIYTTDHGEMLGDHGDAAKSSFYRAACDIPFIVRAPGSWQAAPGQRSSAQVGLLDILPTLVHAAGGQVPQDIDGRDLRGLITQQEMTVRDHFIGAIDGRYLVANDRYRWLYSSSDGSSQCFAADDPSEATALPQDPSREEHFRRLLSSWLQERNSPDVVDGELVNRGEQAASQEQLRAANHCGWGHAGRHLQFTKPV